jgi:dephospho-CoA kinase
LNDIEGIIQAQISRDDRLATADDVINNEGDIKNLRKQIYNLHEFYKSI